MNRMHVAFLTGVSVVLSLLCGCTAVHPQLHPCKPPLSAVNPSSNPHHIKAYLASPLGFSAATSSYMKNVYVPALQQAGITTVNPWDLTTDKEVQDVMSLPLGAERDHKVKELHWLMGQRNTNAIDSCNTVIAELDGQELDSGTAAEVGYAAGKGKLIIGFRSDFRNNGEPGSIVNLQVQYFIEHSGGKIVSSLDELVLELQKREGGFVLQRPVTN